jgi:hypothetical protein
MHSCSIIKLPKGVCGSLPHLLVKKINSRYIGRRLTFIFAVVRCSQKFVKLRVTNIKENHANFWVPNNRSEIENIMSPLRSFRIMEHCCYNNVTPSGFFALINHIHRKRSYSSQESRTHQSRCNRMKERMFI